MCLIRVGDVRVAYAQNLSLSARMDNQAVYGVGSFGPHSLEPVMHGCTFSMQITRYTTTLSDRFKAQDTKTLPENLQSVTNEAGRDGNSLIDATSFNPQLLLLSTSFDIVVYERKSSISADGTSVNPEHGLEGEPIYTLKDCRLSNYSFNFTPGELLIENVSGVARLLENGGEAFA